MYADVSWLDLVNCYMEKNLNAIKVHNDAREKFFERLKNDKVFIDKEVKGIREMAASVKPIDY